MTFRISTDIGGTFTDLVCVDQNGDLRVAKVSTTSKNYGEGIFNALHALGGQYGLAADGVLKQCATFIHGSTVATNAIITHKTAKIGLILTKGHRDILSFREGGKEDPFNPHVDYPEPYVPRYLTETVTERVNAEGGIEIPLDENEARRAVRRLAGEFHVEGIAVCFLWSIANPSHEKRIGEIIEEECPGLSYGLSHRVNPIIREYRRAVSTAMDASLVPLVKKYVDHLDSELKGRGYKETLYVITSSGSLLAADEIVKRPIYTVDSGPTMAPRAGLMYASMEGDATGRIITCDMGGTSFDVSIATDGRIGLSRDTRVANEVLAIMKADVRSIGAGGGSIAWLDPGKMIHVGPMSAGADPGPACYMRGGEEPTVTDANVVLGYLHADYFLGGLMEIDPALSEKAIREKIGAPLNLGAQEAAYAVWTTINHNMVAAIEDITIRQGVDPREYLLVSGGGAAGLHIVPIARELKMKRVIVPKLSGVLSAVGGLAADMTMDFHAPLFTDSKQFLYEGANGRLAKLEEEAREFLLRTGVPVEKTEISFFVEARYAYQVWELTIPLRSGRIADGEDLARLTQDFDDAHERVFGIKEPGQTIEFINWGARAVAQVPKVEVKERPFGGEDPAHALVARKGAYFREMGGLVETPVYRGDNLLYGAKVEGPAIIQEPTSTLVVFPGSRATVSRWGNYLIEVEEF
ncbi:MAG: hydantoinase/oxoprolinase family protein [Syntrophorhabdales bacterium]|jgi:N-methylhydantoinase A